jgi:hypothetical protein
MLYLTHPDDGEWSVEQGGALRVCEPDGQDERLRPKFNRFAAFAVSADSVHEIEPVRWACGWTRCRLALSGWVRAADAGDRLTRLYVRRAEAAADRAAAEARLLGTLASARLLGQQQRHAGLDPADADERRQRAARELDAHRVAPAGTVFVEYVPGPAGGVIVLDEAGTVIYFGPEGGISA